MQASCRSAASATVNRKSLQTRGDLAWCRTGIEFDVEAEKPSPEYTDQDLATIGKAAPSRCATCSGRSPTSLTHATRFDLPVLLFTRRHGYSVSHELTARWFATLKASEKKPVWSVAGAA